MPDLSGGVRFVDVPMPPPVETYSFWQGPWHPFSAIESTATRFVVVTAGTSDNLRLSTDSLPTLLARWGTYCEALFEDLARRAPEELAGLISGLTLAPSDLTFAAEILGRVDDDLLVARTLLPLLDHVSAIVREGAIYGLAGHVTGVVSSRLSDAATADPSPAVRGAARDALDARA